MRLPRIELGAPAWKADMLPLHHRRLNDINRIRTCVGKAQWISSPPP